MADHAPDMPFGCTATWGQPLNLPLVPEGRLHICNLTSRHTDHQHVCKCGDRHDDNG